MRILIVSAWEPVSGVRTAYRMLAKHLAADSIFYDAYAFDAWRTASSWLEFCGRLYGPEDGTLSEVLMNEKYDVVHAIDTAYSLPYGVDLWLRRAQYRGAVVLMSQNSHPALTEKPRAPHVYIACSPASRDNMATVVDAPIRVIENAVDMEVFSPAASEYDGPPILAWVGRSSDDHQKAITAFLYLAARFVQYRCVIADLDDGLARLEFERWLGSRATYCHQVPQSQLRQIYSDVAASGGAVVSTSRFEGLPFALLEAAACGAPVIAPRVPGMEYLTDGETALLYDREQGLTAIENALDRLRDTDLRAALSTNGIAMVAARFSGELMATRYKDAYIAALELKSVQPAHAFDGVRRLAWRLALSARRPIVAHRHRRASG